MKDKNSLETLVGELMYKDIITGFQFTVGRSPLAIKQKEPLELSVSLNKSDNHQVISDYQIEKAVESKIFNELFPDKAKSSASILQMDMTLQQVKIMENEFRKLGYKVNGTKFVGEWYWFIVKCKYNEIPYHLEKLKTINWLEKFGF